MRAVDRSPNERLCVNLWGELVPKHRCNRIAEVMEKQLENDNAGDADGNNEEGDAGAEEGAEDAEGGAAKRGSALDAADLADTPLARLCQIPIADIDANRAKIVDLR